jgi:hypothetical protein
MSKDSHPDDALRRLALELTLQLPESEREFEYVIEYMRAFHQLWCKGSASGASNPPPRR